MFVGLNPSTADETTDDRTIRRCVRFAQDWGYSGLCMTNLFAYRATDPKEMMAFAEPIGAENDQYLLQYAAEAAIVVAAWGSHGTHCNRDVVVRKMLPRLHYLKLTNSGIPRHPLYLPKALKPIQL